MDNNFNKGEGMNMEKMQNLVGDAIAGLTEVLSALEENRTENELIDAEDTLEQAIHDLVVCQNQVIARDKEIAKLKEDLEESNQRHLEHHQEDVPTQKVRAENSKLKKMLEERAAHHYEHHAWDAKNGAELSKTREILHGRIHDLSTDNLRLREAIKNFAYHKKGDASNTEVLRALLAIATEEPQKGKTLMEVFKEEREKNAKA